MMVRGNAVFAFLAWSLTGTSATQELTHDAFHELTESGKNGMVKFFQPWCGHCTRMKPAWDQLAEEAPSSVFIADVNCSDEDDLCQEVGVAGYPTIKVYKDGEVKDYSGGRDFDDLYTYVTENLGPACDVNEPTVACSEKAQKYITKWKGKDGAAIDKELDRLRGMVGESMKADLKKWMNERISVLKQLSSAS